MDRKKELKQMYREMKTEAGVYQIRNMENGKIFISSTRNLKTINGTTFVLNRGGHLNKLLQKDWNKYGEKAFVFEVVEILEMKESPYFNPKNELKKLEQKWMASLQPYGDRGYHREKSR